MILFRPITVEDISEENLSSLLAMNFSYEHKSKDDSISANKMMVAIDAFLRNPQVPWAVWILLDDQDPIGYAITEILSGSLGPEMNITQAFIGEGYRGNGVQSLTIREFEKYAKQKGCSFLTSMTRRGNPEAYIRWMGRAGFNKRCVVVEKDLRRN